MKRVFTLAILGVLVASGAQAAPILVSAGDFVVFNFDFTGETPAPPYSRVGMDVMLSGLDFEPPPCGGPGGVCEPVDEGEWKLWTELNGTGINFFTFPRGQPERCLELPRDERRRIFRHVAHDCRVHHSRSDSVWDSAGWNTNLRLPSSAPAACGRACDAFASGLGRGRRPLPPPAETTGLTSSFTVEPETIRLHIVGTAAPAAKCL
jgi:hypothetical protein